MFSAVSHSWKKRLPAKMKGAVCQRSTPEELWLQFWHIPVETMRRGSPGLFHRRVREQPLSCHLTILYEILIFLFLYVLICDTQSTQLAVADRNNITIPTDVIGHEARAGRLKALKSWSIELIDKTTK